MFRLQLLTNHYERCWKYYCLAVGWGGFGVASDEELHLSRKLFWGIFDALSRKVSQLVAPGGIFCCSLSYVSRLTLEVFITYYREGVCFLFDQLLSWIKPTV